MSGVYAATATLPADGLSCASSCAAAWGWAAAGPRATCCSKPIPTHRAVPPRTLRKTFVPDLAINVTCGFGSGGDGTARYDLGILTRRSRGAHAELGILTRSHEADERYELRRQLRERTVRLHTPGVGRVRACFLFDPTPPHGGVRQPNQLFNTRAWLLFEAGRRADFDLSALTAEANFAPPAGGRDATASVSASWWQRAGVHARGTAPADHYALVPIHALLGARPSSGNAATGARGPVGRWRAARSPRSPMGSAQTLAWASREETARRK